MEGNEGQKRCGIRLKITIWKRQINYDSWTVKKQNPNAEPQEVKQWVNERTRLDAPSLAFWPKDIKVETLLLFVQIIHVYFNLILIVDISTFLL